LNEEDDVTDEQDLRRPLDPVIAGMADAANAGYQALEFVTQGLREGLRRQAGRSAHAPDGATSFAGVTRFGKTGAERAPTGALVRFPQDGERGQLLDNVLGIIDGFLGVATNMTRALAELNTDSDDDPKPQAGKPFQIHLKGPAGKDATGDFKLWNTGPSPLSNVTFDVTELIAASGSIPRSSVSFSPETMQIPPGRSATVKVTVCVPDAAKPGRYHGCVQPTVAGTWAVVDLEVAPALSA
jgi:hypothetical protein